MSSNNKNGDAVEQPLTEAQLNEVHLRGILSDAKLSDYFPIFQSVGADDIQQLFEVNDDEFLEIMALVGMASKPLHVRRFQKSLNRWVDVLKIEIHRPEPPMGDDNVEFI